MIPNIPFLTWDESTSQLGTMVVPISPALVGRGFYKRRQRKFRRQAHRLSSPIMALLFSASFVITFKLANFSKSEIQYQEWASNMERYKSLPAQVLLTNYGWNHPSPSISMQTGRSKFQAWLNQGIEDHPVYNPQGWQLLASQRTSPVPMQRLYVFMDLETCYEENFPKYGWGLTANSDCENGRPHLSSSGGQIRHMRSVCPVIDNILDAPIFQTAIAILVLFDCGWEGPPQWSCLNRNQNVKLNQHSVAIVSESASVYHTPRSRFDLGLPPPAIHPVPLSKTQIASIRNCKAEDRPYFFTFTGNFRHPVRQELLKLHNLADGVLVQHHYGGAWNTSLVGRGTHDQFENVDGNYTTLLSHSVFAGVPRGDNLFSYRFSEALSGGAIPVVYADGWVLPFSSALIDWNSIAIIIPESQAFRTLDYIGQQSLELRCQMRKRSYEFYEKYMSSPSGVIEGIIESLELIR